MKMTALRLLAAAVLAGTSLSAMASPVTTFGPLPVATFGGSGIPNNAVQITTLGGLTLGLTATQRFSAPAVTNDGAGTFSATPGAGTSALLSKWNFDYYIAGNANSQYSFRLFYDFDPGVGTLMSELGFIDFGVNTGKTTAQQDSYNLGQGFLGPNAAFFGITRPSFLTFDPTASGEYSFALVAYNDGIESARSAINVNVAAVPEPASFALLGLGLLGLLAARKRKQV